MKDYKINIIITLKINLAEESISQELRLKNIYIKQEMISLKK